MQSKAKRAVPWSRVRKQGRRWRIFPSKPEKKQEAGWLVLHNPSRACETSHNFSSELKISASPILFFSPPTLSSMTPRPWAWRSGSLEDAVQHPSELAVPPGDTGWLQCQAPRPVTSCLPSSDTNRKALRAGTVEMG